MLRGIAVLMVVLFHLDIVGFKSGFLGVDVFFVISGYLMAMMYDPRNKYDFFIKRAKRLLPAYFATIALTLMVGVIVVAPNDFKQLANQSLFALFFSSNIGFWMENSYFDKSAFKPLLHLWSLGVEIQFYILIPLLYWMFSRNRLFILVICAASAILCFALVGISPKTPFFLLPFRIWEFLIGFGVTTYLMGSARNSTKKLSWIGLVSLVLIIGIPFIDINGASFGFVHGHPGLAALVICLATAAVLIFGVPEIIQNSAIAGVLERVGGYSYSVYLAHFPVIVLFLYQPFGGTITKSGGVVQMAILAALVVAASAALYMFVEKPFRSGVKARGFVFASVFSIFLVGQAGVFAKSLVIPKEEMLIYSAWFDRGEYRCGKLERVLHPSWLSCEITKGLNAPERRVLLVGNSHADSIKSAFVSEAQARNVAVYFMVENDPLIKAGTPTRGVLKEALNRKVDSIVLHYSPLSISNATINELVALSEKNGVSVAFIMPVPVWRDHIPIALLKSLKEGDPLPSQSVSDYAKLNKGLADGVAAIESVRFRIYPVASVFCSDACQFISDDGRPLYFDRGHLTLTGAEKLRGVFGHVIDDIRGGGSGSVAQQTTQVKRTDAD